MRSFKKIVINADDFGYREDINKGIIYAHKNGIVKSTTVLTDREAFYDAVSLAKENPDLKTGLHIDLDDFFNILRPAGTVGNLKNGKSDIENIKGSIDRQIDKFLNSGLKLTHLDSHHHAHLHPDILHIVAMKASELNIPMRFFTAFYDDSTIANDMKQIIDDLNIKYCPHFIQGWYWGNIDEDFEIAELMTHPGFNDKWREFEMAVCCDPNLIQYFKDNNIESISYNEI